MTVVIKKRRAQRTRMGRVSVYEHHGAFWIYYTEARKKRRVRIGPDRDEALRVAGEINAQLLGQRRTVFSFEPVTVDQLADRWLDHHEHVARSSLATVRRYKTATDHVRQFARNGSSCQLAHELPVEGFVRHLREKPVSPNGHVNTPKRKLTDKGLQFVLSTCRSMYAYAARQRLLPPYSENPFREIGIEALRIEDAKPIHAFSPPEIIRFLTACDMWQFPVFATLALTGLRSGELTHVLIEDVDFDQGILNIRSRAQLGWQVKTRRNRSIPLHDSLARILRIIAGDRTAGVPFLRRRFQSGEMPPLDGLSADGLADELSRRQELARSDSGIAMSRQVGQSLAAQLWRDAGVIRSSRLRIEFMRIARRIGIGHITCPKTFRHTFATLMQDANVDPLIRQQLMGHAHSNGRSAGGLGMTGVYTHSRAETCRRQLEAALNLIPNLTEFVEQRITELKLDAADRIEGGI